MRRLHPRDADRVEVPVQEQRAPAAGAAPCRDHARPLVPDDLDVESAVCAPAGDERRKLALPLPTRNETGVDRIDRDEPSRQLGQLYVGRRRCRVQAGREAIVPLPARPRNHHHRSSGVLVYGDFGAGRTVSWTVIWPAWRSAW